MYCKTYSIRLFPTVKQEQSLMELIAIRNDIWNNLIDIANDFYATHQKTLHNYGMHKEIVKLKASTKPEWSQLNSKAAQRVATTLFAGYQLYFSNLKKKKNASLPKKLQATDIRSLVFNQSGWSVEKNKIITINKIAFRYGSHIDNLEELHIKEVCVKYRNGKWLADLVVELEETYPETIEPKKVLALDLGLKRLATGIDSNGKVVKLPNQAKKVSKYFGKEIAKIDQKLSKKKKNSRRYKKLKSVRQQLFHRKNSQVKQTLHIQSKKLVNMNYHTIVIGDLSVQELMQKENNKIKGTRKSFSQSNIGMFLMFLMYKSIGKSNVIKIDERYTTQLNCLTGLQFLNKVELKDRTVRLSETIEIDRDLNAAINIFNRWYSNQLVPLIAPLSLDNVLASNNLLI
jgi:putative transposase